MTGQPRVPCSAAGLFRDRHMATDRQYHLATPGGEQYTFCGACCLVYFACSGLASDAIDRDAAVDGGSGSTAPEAA